MPSAPAGISPWFVFDQHVSGPALRQLRERGVDIVHVAEADLADADDPDVFAWAAREQRIVVTRNYADDVALVEAWARQGMPFPGVLFHATSVRHNDVGHHVLALIDWMETAATSGTNPVQNSAGWLR